MKTNNKKPEVKKLVFDNEGIVEFYSKQKAKKFGTSSHIILPKELLDKEVNIVFNAKRIRELENSNLTIKDLNKIIGGKKQN